MEMDDLNDRKSKENSIKNDQNILNQLVSLAKLSAKAMNALVT